MRVWGLCLLTGVVGVVAVVGLVQVLEASARTTLQRPGVLPISPLSLSVDPVANVPIDGGAFFSAPLGYGMNVRDPAHLETLFAPLGFEWVKLYEQYDALPTERLPYKVLYRLQLDGPPDDLAAWGDHVEAVARAGRGLVEAYEVGNEPNQSWQWGGQVPDPGEYVAALREAYGRIKAVDPDAIVVSGGLGPVGRVQATDAGEGWPGNNGASMDEWEYAGAMFTRCLTGCFDAFGYHPFGFAYAPEITPSSVSNNFAFRGAEDLRQIMLAYGLGDRPMWATEFGWIRNPDPDGYGWCKLVPEFNDAFGWMLVDELQQADYLSRAFAYADAHWPWMGAMFVWNLDWNDQGWDCSDIRFFSLRYVDGDATPAYETLAALGNRPRPTDCRLQVDPAFFTWLAYPPDRCSGSTLCYPAVLTGVVATGGVGYCQGVTWTARLSPGGTLRPALSSVASRLGQPLTLTVDTGAQVVSGTGSVLLYPPGVYTALLTLSTLPVDVVGSPQKIHATLIVAPAWQRLYLPLVVRDFEVTVGLR